jgi:hypothetical protein
VRPTLGKEPAAEDANPVGYLSGDTGIGLATFPFKLSMTSCQQTLRRLTIICLICPALALPPTTPGGIGSTVLGEMKAVARAMIIEHFRSSAVFISALLTFFAGTISAVPQGTTPERGTLPTVNGAAFTSGPVSIDNTHCGWNYALGGGAFYAATVPEASDFPQGCMIAITNTDLAACKGKSIRVAGFSTPFVLWPYQVVELTNVNNAWVETINPGRWRPNCGGGDRLIINTDSEKGSDLIGVSDGLGTGTEAFKSVQFALQRVLTDFDFAGVPQTRVRILMAAGSTDSTDVHYTPHASNPGSQGGAALMIDGNGGYLTGGVEFYFGAIVQIRNVTLSNASGSCLVSTQSAYVEINDLVTFGACGAGPHLAISAYGTVELFNDITISGNATNFVQNFHGTLRTYGGAIRLANDITYSQSLVFAFHPGVTALQDAKWALDGHTVTAKKYDVEANHVLTGAANIPGTAAGTTATGGQAF